MSIHKTKIDQEKVARFLNDSFNRDCHNIIFITGGESSQAFSFSADGSEYVIRVNRDDESFKKDQYAHEHFASFDLPIPRILTTGQLDDQYFAISQKVEGRCVQNLTSEEYGVILPKLISTLEVVHAATINATSGYGKWNPNGQGECQTWNEYILSCAKYAEVFPEKKLWIDIYSCMERLLVYCPEDRHLIHGDYGYDNVLSDGKRITGVIDWGESKYGDPLFDIAWMNFWAKDYSPVGDFNKYFRDLQEGNGVTYQHYEERIRCYELHTGLSALSFYAYSKQPEKFAFAQERVSRLLG